MKVTDNRAYNLNEIDDYIGGFHVKSRDKVGWCVKAEHLSVLQWEPTIVGAL